MEKIKISSPVIFGACSFIIFILSWVCIDVSGVIKNIVVLLNIESIEKCIIVIDFLVKSVLLILLGVLMAFGYFIYLFREQKKSKRYDIIKVLNFIKKNKKKEIKEIIIFGYSLSFAEPIRDYLYKEANDNLTVNLVIPTIDFIKNNLEENKAIETRLEVLKGRITEWEILKNEKRIKELCIHYYENIPFEYGVLIDDEILFMFFYKWNLHDKKVKIEKAPLKDRSMLKLTHKKDASLFNYFYCKLTLATGKRKEVC